MFIFFFYNMNTELPELFSVDPINVLFSQFLDNISMKFMFLDATARFTEAYTISIGFNSGCDTRRNSSLI